MSAAGSERRGHAARFPSHCRKTKLCRFHLAGLCAKGPDCTFAHGAEELRHASNDTVASSTTIGDDEALLGDAASPSSLSLGPLQRPPQLNHLRHPIVGHQDSLESRGPLPHEDGAYAPTPEHERLRSVEGFAIAQRNWEVGHQRTYASECSFGSKDSVGPSISMGPSISIAEEVRKGENFKTKFCAFYLTGGCKKGATCNFAHSGEEIRSYDLPVESESTWPADRKPFLQDLETTPMHRTLTDGDSASELLIGRRDTDSTAVGTESFNSYMGTMSMRSMWPMSPSTAISSLPRTIVERESGHCDLGPLMTKALTEEGCGAASPKATFMAAASRAGGSRRPAMEPMDVGVTPGEAVEWDRQNGVVVALSVKNTFLNIEPISGSLSLGSRCRAHSMPLRLFKPEPSHTEYPRGIHGLVHRRRAAHSGMPPRKIPRERLELVVDF